MKKPKDKLGSFLEYFSRLEDPRIERKKLFPLDEILLVVLCAIICGAEGWDEFQWFGQQKIVFLKSYLPFKNGIPSRFTYSRVISSLNPDEFKTCFIDWVQSFQKSLKEVIAIDGKTLRHTFDTAKDKPAIHMVSAFAANSKIILGQQKTSDKSNEITAIPKLLNLLSIKDSIITIDAMGCQKDIAEMIIKKEADYILALKANQGNLYEDVKSFLEQEAKREKEFHDTSLKYFEETDKAHGRIETRKCWVTEETDWIYKKENWRGLTSIAMVESIRTLNGKTTKEKRFYIASLPPNAEIIGKAVRSHWGIENSLHWVLDMTYREDESRIRDKNAAENLAIIRHTSLNMLQNYKQKTETKTSIKGLRKKAGWNNNLLAEIVLKN